jgi:uncharacterized protein
MNQLTTSFRKASYLLLFTLTLLTSCAYNNKFLAPAKYNNQTRAVTTVKTKTDSIIVSYKGSAPYPPTFLQNGTDTIRTDYTTEAVMFSSSNGNTLNGWMLKPKSGTPTATLLNLHGNGGSILGQHVYIKAMLTQGFQIFVFDYSGYGFSNGEATRVNLLTDGIAAVDYLRTREDVKNTKLVLFGQSFGGHLAACVAAKREASIDALVIEGGFSNHKDLASDGAKPFIAFMSRIFVKEIYAATDYIQKYHKPLLLIHSSEDKIIPFKMGQKVFTKANEPKELFEIKGSHLEGTSKYTKEIADKIKAMIK